MALAHPYQHVAGATDIKIDPNHPVEVFYGSAQYNNIKDMAAGDGITIYPEDKIETFPDPLIGIGSKIIITRATPVLVIDAKKSYTYRTWVTTIADLLKEKKIDLLGQDSSLPGISAPISYAWNL